MWTFPRGSPRLTQHANQTPSNDQENPMISHETSDFFYIEPYTICINMSCLNVYIYILYIYIYIHLYVYIYINIHTYKYNIFSKKKVHILKLIDEPYGIHLHPISPLPPSVSRAAPRRRNCAGIRRRRHGGLDARWACLGRGVVKIFRKHRHTHTHCIM